MGAREPSPGSLAQYILQRFRIENLNKWRGVGNTSCRFQPFEFSVQRGSGHIHQHCPSGNGTGDPDGILPGLSCLHQKPEGCFLRFRPAFQNNADPFCCIHHMKDRFLFAVALDMVRRFFQYISQIFCRHALKERAFFEHRIIHRLIPFRTARPEPFPLKKEKPLPMTKQR